LSDKYFLHYVTFEKLIIHTDPDLIYNVQHAQLCSCTLFNASDLFSTYKNVILNSPSDENIRVKEAYYFSGSKKKVVYINISIIFNYL
jgi:hypothetical protein